MLPTLPRLPLTIREATEPFAQPACTFAFSLGGLPAMSVPCGYSRSGLPIGVLIGGPPLSEPHIFALAQAYEGATELEPAAANALAAVFLFEQVTPEWRNRA